MSYYAIIGCEVLQRSTAGLKYGVSFTGAQQIEVHLQGSGVEEPAGTFRIVVLYHWIVKAALQHNQTRQGEGQHLIKASTNNNGNISELFEVPYSFTEILRWQSHCEVQALMRRKTTNLLLQFLALRAEAADRTGV